MGDLTKSNAYIKRVKGRFKIGVDGPNLRNISGRQVAKVMGATKADRAALLKAVDDKSLTRARTVLLRMAKKQAKDKGKTLTTAQLDRVVLSRMKTIFD